MNKHQNLLTEKEQERLYLVHHMHHISDGKDAVHELHHCFLFSEKNMQGEKFIIDHMLYKGKLYHVLDRATPSVLYDHADNDFQVKKVRLGNKDYYTFE